MSDDLITRLRDESQNTDHCRSTRVLMAEAADALSGAPSEAEQADLGLTRDMLARQFSTAVPPKAEQAAAEAAGPEPSLAAPSVADYPGLLEDGPRNPENPELDGNE